MGPQLMFAAVMQIVSSFTADIVARNLVGFPSTDYAAHTVMTHAFDYGWVRYEMGYASAICMVLFVCMFLVHKPHRQAASQIYGLKEEPPPCRIRKNSGAPTVPAGQKNTAACRILVILTLPGSLWRSRLSTVITAFKPVEELFVISPEALSPPRPTLDNFRDMFRVLGEMWVPFSRYVFNSAAITVIVRGGAMLCRFYAAFVLAKCEFPGRRFLNGLIVVSLLL